MRPRCSILAGGCDFSGCGDCTTCPPFAQIEMSNNEPSVMVCHGSLCIGGLYMDSNGASGSRKARGHWAVKVTHRFLRRRHKKAKRPTSGAPRLHEVKSTSTWCFANSLSALVGCADLAEIP